jgi:hypothetical protein
VVVARLVVLGADGLAGGRVVRALERQGHEVAVRPHALAVADRDVLAEAVRGRALAVSLLGGDPSPLLEVAIADGVHVVAATDHAVDVRTAIERHHPEADARGVRVVVGAGVPGVPGDPLAHLAATAVRAPAEVHVCYALPAQGGGPLRALTPGGRRRVIAAIGRPGLVHEGASLVEEHPGEQRRLAWFPRPVGPTHAVGVPGPEPVLVPTHVPSVRKVRTSLALTSWRAELLQAAASVAATRRGRAWLARRVGRPRRGAVDLTRMRWACVAEARGHDGVARAWAYGTDPVRLAAASVVGLVEAVLAGQPDAGVVAPSLTTVPSDLLDHLAAVTDLRWSVVRPGG